MVLHTTVLPGGNAENIQDNVPTKPIPLMIFELVSSRIQIMRCAGNRAAYEVTNKVLLTDLEKEYFIKYFYVKYKGFGE
jgi:hypothetical protein